MTSTLTAKQYAEGIAPTGIPSDRISLSLADAIQTGKILYASGLFKLENEEQAVAIILRGQELGIPPVASLMKGKTIVATTPQKSNAQRISNLLNQLGVTDPTARKAMATQYLGGRRAADYSPHELEGVLTAIRQAYEQEATEEAEAIEMVTVANNSADAIESGSTQTTVETSDDDPIDTRAAIAASLDGAGITDVDRRQALVKKQLMAVGRRKVESLTPDELKTVIEGIVASAA